MKNIWIYNLILAGLLSSCGQHGNRESMVADDAAEVLDGQSDSGSTAQPAPQNVEEIQQVYARTSALIEQGTLDTLSFDYNCQDEKRGKVRYYAKDGKLLAIEHSYGEYDHYEAVDRYYVHRDSVYFAYLKGTAWSFVSGQDGTTKDDITERRIYIVQGEAISCLEKKYSTQSNLLTNPESKDIANKKVDCSADMTVTKPYDLLARHYGKPTTGCLE